MYLAYPTSQDTSEEYPEEFTAPAITMCNNNRLLRQRLCKQVPWECTWENTTKWDEFCEEHKRRCTYTQGYWEKTDDFVFASPSTDGFFQFDHGNLLLNQIGPQNETDLIDHCNVWINEVRGSCNSSMMIQAAKDSYPYKCFTFFSLLGKPDEQSLNLSVSDAYTFLLHMHPEKYTMDNDVVQAYIVLHDPRQLVNPMTEGVTLKPGKHYNLYVTMEQKASLPPPYASKCEDYSSKWKKNGGHGPLSKKDCIHVCVIEAMVDKYGCVSQQITYPNNYEICGDNDLDTTSEMMQKCHSICPDACEESTYSFTSQVTFDVASNECHTKDDLCKNAILQIIVRFTRMTVQKFQHIPRFESIELFSYIGGYLGMWLGISLASLFDFGELIYDTVHPFLKGKKKQKTTTPTEKFQNQIV